MNHKAFACFEGDMLKVAREVYVLYLLTCFDQLTSHDTRLYIPRSETIRNRSSKNCGTEDMLYLPTNLWSMKPLLRLHCRL